MSRKRHEHFKWEPKPREPNLFFQNVETHNPGHLMSFVYHELGFFYRYLQKAIRSMDVERYGLKWEKDASIRYQIEPSQRINVQKPHKRIKVFISPSEFRTDIPIQREDGIIVEIVSYEEEEEGIVVFLDEKTQLNPKDIIYYRMRPVEWKTLSVEFSSRLEYLEDCHGSKYQIQRRKMGSDYYEFEMKNPVPSNIELYIDGIKIEYEERSISTLVGIQLRDEKDNLNYVNVSDSKFIIETPREIEGTLSDLDGRYYKYKELAKGKKPKGTWIVLYEPETTYDHADEDQGSLLDIFFELLSAAFEYEVWEEPDIKGHSKTGRIKILRSKREESKLLLEREPSNDLIFPPKNTYQLKMQLQAVKTLSRYPAFKHRNLLKLFERYDSVDWEPLSTLYTNENVDWKILTTDKREGTEEQRKFVLKSLNTPDFAILEGPPGSGKTTAIAELVFQLLRLGKRVLLSASTHVAIDNVIENLAQEFLQEGGLKRNGIVPLRVGREESISEEVKNYQLDKRIEEMKKQIDKEDWFVNLPADKQDESLNELVIRSSNLVCGTTIGVLQYPPFKKKRQDYVSPEFDYLIIDEASKTTFQEFLVPAIHAEKWILTGDIHQLSPYTETLHVRVNLEGILDSRAQETAQLVFLKLVFDQAKLPGKRRSNQFLSLPKYIYVGEIAVIVAIHELLKQKLSWDIEKSPNERRYDHLQFGFVTESELPDSGLPHIFHFPKDSFQSQIYSIFGKNFIFVQDEAFKRVWRDLPATHILIYPNNPNDPDCFEYRHDYWLKINQDRVYSYKLPKGGWTYNPNLIKHDILSSLLKSWAGEIAWRMKRVYELNLKKSEERVNRTINYYETSMRALLPPERSANIEVWRDVKKIAQISFPSILTSLQEGVTQYYRPEGLRTVLSSGFPESILLDRHELLSYQHRMHPEISDLPRLFFYKEKGALRDVKAITEEGIRDWSFDGYQGRRRVWKDVSGKNVYVSRNSNEKEALAILDELRKFLNWVKSQNDGEKRQWKVLLLSFYENQRKKLRDLIKTHFPEQNNQRKQTRFRIGKVRVYCYTVDKVQGREADVIFLSMVQNNRLGFMDSPNRLNVAITRAKYLLVIVGDWSYFAEHQRGSFELGELAKRSLRA